MNDFRFKGTPAPWTGLSFSECIAICRKSASSLRLGFVSSPSAHRVAEGRANAFLIAAAPDLFEALRACLPFADEEGFVNGVNIKAALLKALGETP